MEQTNNIKPKGSRGLNILIFISLLFLVSSPMIFVGSIINLATNYSKESI
ncbi:hypothetical protein OWI77_12605 [Staphylococcus nepalensis]|nr:hypothetical protein [Staphylococcus nepalensis]MCY1039641.1 hypothetical protein [Staphylococcus nepalensis]